MSNFCPDWSQGAAEGIRVEQTPGTLLVTEGATANLSCQYAADGIQDYAINWLHRPADRSNQTEVIIYMDKHNGNKSVRLVHTIDRERNISQLSISDLQMGDSGTYYCELMVLNPPSTKELVGKGSILTVMGKKGVEHCSPPTGTVPEDTSRSGTTIYATLFSARNGEDPQDLEIVNSDPLVEKKATDISPAEVEYSTVNRRKAEPKTESGHDVQMVYSKLQFKKGEMQ
ncbi:hypothetical protein chiPu_0019236 [Chiloscyllium punctatum]|uniref:Ig-like domain-containing protein n=1 Tax=Chiloscyllium punctatum TaxID=137246 RepID=A0A401RR18_CHIPU|nr:hypothetical protein [Chiloscyllium punctatum]